MFSRNTPSAPDAPDSQTPANAPNTPSGEKAASAPSVEALVVAKEELVGRIQTEQREIVVTTSRLILREHGAGAHWSVIPLSAVSALEVSDASNGGVHVKVHFGGGLSRTVGLPSVEAAINVAGALAR